VLLARGRRVLENEAIKKLMGDKVLEKRSVQAQLEHWKREAAQTEHERKLLHDRVKELSSSLDEAESQLREQAHVLSELDTHKARQEKYFRNKLELLQVAHEDDTKGLSERVRELTATLTAKEHEYATLLGKSTSPEQLIAENKRCLEQAALADERRLEAEAEAAKQVADCV